MGLGLITCNAPQKFCQSAPSIPAWLSEVVVVNDGEPYDANVYRSDFHIIQHQDNRGVAVSKNDALRYLLDKGCEHIFIMEDDVVIRDEGVFEAYIRAREVTGISHFNYALQGPHNRDQSKPGDRILKKILKLLGKKIEPKSRECLDENARPNPRYVHTYPGGVNVAFYRHCVGAFSYYHRGALEASGLMDEHFYNAWEHVEHTYQLAKRGFTSPFWWFADLADSEQYLQNIPDCMAQSTIAAAVDWNENIKNGEDYFLSKEGIGFAEIEKTSLPGLVGWLDLAARKANPYKLLIKFPTRARAGKFFEVLDQYIAALDDRDNTFFIVSCDLDDGEMNNSEVRDRFSHYRNLTVCYGNNKSKIEAINADMDDYDRYDIILLASDDMIPVVPAFDRIIRERMFENFPDLDGVLWFNDGYRGNDLNTLCILGKKYYERFGYIYHPAYKSLWCDDEFTRVADLLGRQVYFEDVIIKHDHPDIPGSDVLHDELMIKNQALDGVDKRMFKQRKKSNFGLKKKIMKRNEYYVVS